ncbi:hypothetical protein H2203_002337 [Taxawa tesnikishii (nom. ined.)]|nr:hypothetical protein H2203_002337 [Dothideales sp. JES 119]
MARNQSAAASPFPLAYRLFFLYIEPVATAVGAYYAHLLQDEYLQLTYTSAEALMGGPSVRESIVLSQLANMYLVFALNEAFVLRATSDLNVWRIFLFGLLVADFGHIYSVKSVGSDIYWQFWDWNAIYWGNLGFVYVGATLRMAFLAGIGLSGSGARKTVK